ncbi:uncharacterized protein LOC143612485 [Bidens hawaiensis]|uniref:uncharacterized protein LOC143612485 n=1 Tax=Bidens hawaiensis TaxID=980011 RepID=UPI00404AE3C2
MAQAARLNLRMQKELKIILTDPPPGASFPRLSSNSDLSSFSLTEIDAEIEGPEDTVYEKGVFKINIQIPERYPFQPPIVTFGTPIYHPNIDTGGRICLDILNLPPKGAWQPSLNISTVLTSIGLLLSEPNPDDGLMCEASKEYKYNKQVFDQKARSMTEKFARPGASPNNGGNQSVTNLIMSDDKPLEPVKTDLLEYATSFKKLSGISRKLSLDASCSGPNTRESDIGRNEITLNTVCQSHIQEPKQDSKDVSFESGKDHVLTTGNSDRDHKAPAISSKKLCLSSKNPQHKMDSTIVNDLDARKENLQKVQKKSNDGNFFTNPKRKKLSLDASCSGPNTICKSLIQEPKQDSKDMSFESANDHVLTVVNSAHDECNKPPTISTKKPCFSSKNPQHEIQDLTVLDDLDAQKEKLLKVQKKSNDGNCFTKPKRKKLSLIQEPKQESNDVSLESGKDHVSIVVNSNHDRYNKSPTISSKNLKHEALDSTVLQNLDAQKENLLTVPKKSTDGNCITNPKHKKLGLTGKKPSLSFLGKPLNRNTDNKVKAREKDAISVPIPKLSRKPLQVLEGNAKVMDINVTKNDEESLEQGGLCDSEGVIVLDSEDSEEEKPSALNSRRLIARKRVLGRR